MYERVDLTIKNYRCFSDENPLRLPLAAKTLAFVGENNAGKSAALKFIHELQPIWNRSVDGHLNLQTEQDDLYSGIGTIARDVADQNEIYTDQNDRNISFAFDFDSSIAVEGEQRNDVGRLDLILNRPGHGVRGKLYRKIEGRYDRLLVDVDRTRGLFIQGSTPVLSAKPVLDIFQRFSNALYVPSFRNSINEGGGQYYGINVGSSFIGLWDIWKSGHEKQKNRAAIDTQEIIRQVFGFRSLDINASADGKDLQLTIDGRPYRLAEVGSGIAHFTIALVSVLVRQPPLILIDEPELGLHPRLQLEFLSILSAKAKGWIFFATHSLGLARAFAEHVIAFRRNNGRPVTGTMGALENYGEFLGELSFSAWRELGCNRIILVEGPKDVRAVGQLLRKIGKDKDTICLPLSGSSLISSKSEHELAEITRFNCSVSVLIDSERASVDAPLEKSREEFGQMCKRLGFTVQVMERRAIENYFSDRAVKAAFGSVFRSLAPFEKLSDASPSWRKSDNWLVAIETQFEEIANTDLGQFLKQV